MLDLKNGPLQSKYNPDTLGQILTSENLIEIEILSYIQ